MPAERVNHIHVLVRGLIATDQSILLARCKGAANTFLPGGHVETGEAMTEALRREIFEELALPCRVGAFLGVIEHQWQERDCHQHEINHLFAVSLPGAKSLPQLVSQEEHLEFFWVKMADLPHHNLHPYPLVEFIRRHLGGSQEAFWASTLLRETD